MLKTKSFRGAGRPNIEIVTNNSRINIPKPLRKNFIACIIDLLDM